MRYSGGHVLLQTSIIKTNRHTHTTALERPLSGTTLQAVNAVQHTPWAINGWMLDVLADAWTGDSDIAGMPKAYGVPIPEALPEAVWNALTKPEQIARRGMVAELHGENARAESRRLYVIDCLTSARELRNQPGIWFPHFLDFRTRMYPSAHRGPHPQANDMGKALLHFAVGQPLGPTGLYWLAVRAANAAGQDKLSMDDRVAWVLEHMQEIEDSARRPLEGGRFWADVDEPWSFLATCRELSLAWAEENPALFVSHLPVPLDGSCNGLQHLSAMGLDPVGAKATNLTADPQRHDIYLEVAAAVNELVKADALMGKPEAVHWMGKVTRATVKRAVMTTPYGVTPMGIRDQLLADGFVQKDPVLGPSDLAGYLRTQIVSAVSRTVVAAKDIMAWLQGCAETMAKANQAIEWTTPAGSRIRQGYFQSAARKIETLQGEVTVYTSDTTAIDPKKAALAAAPNVVHSFDAAHLQITVAALHDCGLRAFAMIHDSYGTHAANTEMMGHALRDTFVDIYRTDWLKELHADFCAQAPAMDIPPPPARGEFDVSEVLNSAFFFA